MERRFPPYTVKGERDAGGNASFLGGENVDGKDIIRKLVPPPVKVLGCDVFALVCLFMALPPHSPCTYARQR